MYKTKFITAEYAKWLSSSLKPNVYAVGTLMQRRQCHQGAMSYLVRGNRDDYGKAYDQFIRRFSKSIYGPTNWKRHRELIPNLATLEGGEWRSSKGCLRYVEPHANKSGVRFHYNICLRRPDWIPFDEFAGELKRHWAEGDWMMPDCFVEERRGDCVSYSMKEGPESLMPNSMSWPLQSPPQSGTDA
jgi:hypothetical protein